MGERHVPGEVPLRTPVKAKDHGGISFATPKIKAMAFLKVVKRSDRRAKERVRDLLDRMKDSQSYTLLMVDGRKVTKTGAEWKANFKEELNPTSHGKEENGGHDHQDPPQG